MKGSAPRWSPHFASRALLIAGMAQYIPPPKAPEPVEVLPSKQKLAEKTTTTTIEVLNAPSVRSSTYASVPYSEPFSV